MKNHPTIFPEQPDIRPINETEYRLNNSFLYETELHYIHVPTNFVHDGASVPRLAWTISGLTPDGLLRAAALVHDWLYTCKGRTYRRTYKRKEADQLFKEIMLKSGVSSYKANLAYLAVRVGGWTYWN